MTDRRLVVLGYHRIGPPPPGGWDTWFFVPEATFAEHLRVLREEGWSLIGATEFLAAIADPGSLPERAALLTFDDAYGSMVTRALPVLRAASAPAVLFVPTAYVGAPNDFDPHEPRERLCDWDELRLLQRHGVSIQSHGATHRTFSALTPDQQVHEAAVSKGALEARLETPVDLLAYPFGDPGGHREQLDDALDRLGYSGAFTYPGGHVPLPVRDRFCIDRVAIGPDTDLCAVLAAETDMGPP